MSDDASDLGQRLIAALQAAFPDAPLPGWWPAAAVVLLATLVLFAFGQLVRAATGRIEARVRGAPGARIWPLRFQEHEIFSAEEVASVLAGAVAWLGRIAFAVGLYLYAHVCFSLFGPTRGLAARLLDYLVSAALGAGWAVLHYLPNLFWLLVIFYAARFLIRLARLFFEGVTAGRIRLPGLHPEFGKPTFEIARLLIAVLTIVIMFPYLPGRESPAFRAIGLFVGVLVSLGSTGAVANVISGIVLTYTRAFRVGDRVRIADAAGDVVEKTSFATRIRTVKNVEITIPNAMTLANHIVNYSAQARERGIILHTGVTIGYDVPWARVHELLVAAALETDGIEPEPAPFVHQIELLDAYVHYELNATTRDAKRMQRIYSELHQHIQDRFHAAGVEIASPHFLALRDGGRASIPDQYLPRDYQAPALRIGPLEWRGGGGSKGGGPT